MTPSDQDASAMLVFSIVIPVYNDWLSLDQCLQSLNRQVKPPSFEVVVVDDGSTEPASECTGSRASYPITTIRQSHAGIPAARNRGIRAAKGEFVLFVDADCRLRTDCLANLSATIMESPQHDWFQLRLVGDCSNLVGRAEELRLLALQDYLLQPDGRIKYLNTAGFAIRRSRADSQAEVFDPVALRAEDTLLLANLMQREELPLFVSGAIVEHIIPLTLIGCLRKDIRSVFLEVRTYNIIAAKQIRIRVTHRERVRLIWLMWKIAGHSSIGRAAWVVLLARQALQRTIFFGCQGLVGFMPRMHRQL